MNEVLVNHTTTVKYAKNTSSETLFWILVFDTVKMISLIEKKTRNKTETERITERRKNEEKNYKKKTKQQKNTHTLDAVHKQRLASSAIYCL